MGRKNRPEKSYPDFLSAAPRSPAFCLLERSMEETVRTLLQNHDTLEGPKVDPLDLMKAYKVSVDAPSGDTPPQDGGFSVILCF